MNGAKNINCNEEKNRSSKNANFESDKKKVSHRPKQNAHFVSQCNGIVFCDASYSINIIEVKASAHNICERTWFQSASSRLLFKLLLVSITYFNCDLYLYLFGRQLMRLYQCFKWHLTTIDACDGYKQSMSLRVFATNALLIICESTMNALLHFRLSAGLWVWHV